MADTSAQPQWPSNKRAWTVTSLLLLAYILSFIDRQILNLLAEPIRQDLGLTDLDMSFLQGPAFVATYILLSLPLGHLSDSVNRTKLLAIGLGFWTVATMACGFAKSFTHLAIARAGVGVGEATLTPTAWSILADSFPPERRSAPVSIYLTGPYVGGGLALIFGAQILGVFAGPVDIGGWVFQPWQLCFIIVGAPGLLLALAISGSKEPRRQLSAADNPEQNGLSEFATLLKGQWRIYAGIWLGAGQLAVMLYGLQAWTPTYLMRVHEWTIGEAGYYYGLVALFAGSIGVLNGPIIHRWLLKKTGKDYALYMGFACGLLLAPISLLLTIVPGSAVLIVIAVLSYLVTTPLALMTTTLQLVTPNLFRGRASGIHVVATNILGLGFGPTFVAFMTQKVFADPMMVGQSMTAQFVVFGLGAAGCYLIGAGPLMRSAANRARTENEAEGTG
jgi:MFS family permease